MDEQEVGRPPDLSDHHLVSALLFCSHLTASRIPLVYDRTASSARGGDDEKILKDVGWFV